VRILNEFINQSSVGASDQTSTNGISDWNRKFTLTNVSVGRYLISSSLIFYKPTVIEEVMIQTEESI